MNPVLERIPRSVTLAALLLATFLLGGCAGGRQPAPGTRTEPGSGSQESHTVGTASWYGKTFHGRTTASGEPYDMYALTAAHRTLPFGARIRVTNLANGRQVTVRINDRGPFKKGRIIDLSYQAAKQIGMIQDGVTKVRLEILEPRI